MRRNVIRWFKSWFTGQDVGPPSARHPYLQGRYEFERFFGDLARRCRAWQVAAILALVINTILAIALGRLALERKVVPYVVELDALGETRTVSTLAVRDVPERVLVVTLRRFVHNIRTIPTDSRLLNTRLEAAQAVAAGPALETFIQEVRDARTHMEHMLLRGESRYVEEISSVLKVPGESRIYRVTWRESLRTQAEHVEHAMEGYFQVRTVPPETEAEVLDNPFGIYITDYTWSMVGSVSASGE